MMLNHSLILFLHDCQSVLLLHQFPSYFCLSILKSVVFLIIFVYSLILILIYFRIIAQMAGTVVWHLIEFMDSFGYFASA